MAVSEEIIRLRADLEKAQVDMVAAKEELQQANARLYRYGVRMNTAAEAARILREANSSLHKKLAEESMKNKIQERIMADLQYKLELMGRSDSDLEKEINSILEECDEIAKKDGIEFSEHKTRMKHLDRLIVAKHQVAAHRAEYKSGPGSTSEPPAKQNDSPASAKKRKKK